MRVNAKLVFRDAVTPLLAGWYLEAFDLQWSLTLIIQQPDTAFVSKIATTTLGASKYDKFKMQNTIFKIQIKAA